MSHYRGWTVYRGPAHPVTGTWRARRAGVGMCAGSEDALHRMIDQKVTDERIERDRRLSSRFCDRGHFDCKTPFSCSLPYADRIS